MLVKTPMNLTEKQREVWRESMSHPVRWNISVGAVRSGKTYLDYYRIPVRIMNAVGGVVIIGNTVDTVERNILSQMRRIYGGRLVGRVKKGGMVRLFGKDCLVLGASRTGAADRLQGMSVGYCYGDEMTTWCEDVFGMLKSRMDSEKAVFDGSCNPSYPHHWVKQFIDREEKNGNLRVYHFSMDDNTELSPWTKQTIKKEYEGTVYYDRYVLGRWTAAEGCIYRQFAENREKFIIDRVNAADIIMADIGVDFGGNGSATAFNLTGYTRGYGRIITLDEYYRKEIISPVQLERDFVGFVKRALKKYPCLRDVYCDSAEQVLKRGLENAVRREGLAVEIHNARKKSIHDRIRFYCSLMGQGRYFIHRKCTHTAEAFEEAVWKKGTEERLDNGSVNIDSLDAQEYSTEHRMNEIIQRDNYI